jgi:MIP family channel proteins
VLLYVSLIFGFSLMVNVWIFFRISGGLFNPAVTLAMALVKAIPPVRAACLFVAQLLGSMLASVIVRFLFPETFNVRTTLSAGTSLTQGVFIEAMLTAELVFTIFMLAKEKHRATFIAPVGIGLSLFIAEMVGVQFTGGSLNPARSFGPCVVTLTFDEEHWIYWVGPLIGALLAIAFYHFIKTLEYEVSISRTVLFLVDVLLTLLRWQTPARMEIQSTIPPRTQRREQRFQARGGRTRMKDNSGQTDGSLMRQNGMIRGLVFGYTVYIGVRRARRPGRHMDVRVHAWLGGWGVPSAYEQRIKIMDNGIPMFTNEVRGIAVTAKCATGVQTHCASGGWLERKRPQTARTLGGRAAGLWGLAPIPASSRSA